MTPEEVEDLLRRSGATAPDPALRERALAAARARWDARPPLRWPWFAAAAAAALVALDLGVCAWNSDGPENAPARTTVAAAITPGTPTLLAALRSRDALGGMP
jgi:hypothetical protein